ncbi:citrate (pro-3S)-lyase subunit beta [Pseudomonas sp. No.117]
MRSKLFVPGSRPELFDKAMASAADGISFDLEDAVAPAAKEWARQQLAAYLERLGDSPKHIVVRINAQDTAHYEADLAAVVSSRVDIINLPKVEEPGQVRHLADQLERLERQIGLKTPVLILATIESPRGVRRAGDIAAAHPRVAGLQLGFADLLEPLGMDRYQPQIVQQLQLSVRLAAGEAQVPIYDAAFPAIADPEGYSEEARHAHALGFAGKSCIHPSQIALANAAFLPSREEVARSRLIVAAAQQAEREGQGAYQVEGRMVDGPFVARARQLLEQAQSAGLLD